MRKARTPINVRVFFDGREIKKSDLTCLIISNITVDRVVNSVADRCV